MTVYNDFRPRRTHQNVRAHPEEHKNEAGGYVFAPDKWQRLNRFLVLGTEGGSYYVQAGELTRQNAVNLLDCIAEDGNRVVNTIAEYSTSGRTFRQSPLLFALALASTEGDLETRKLAYDVLPAVCRIPTHLFEFVKYRTNFGGWGRGLRNAVARWYTDRPVESLAYHAIKYQSRMGWSNADLLRLSHPSTEDARMNDLFRWILDKEGDKDLPDIVGAFEQVKVADNVKRVCNLVIDYQLPREAIPTRWLNEASVWEALLATMPMTAMIRNLGKMTSVGLLTSTSLATRQVVERLQNQEYLTKARVHPMAVLLAHTTYEQGRGVRGSLSWTPIRQILDATDQAFYLTFGNVEPTGRAFALALDESGSMRGATIANTWINCRTAAAAQALITLNVEPDVVVYAFDTKIREIAMSPRQRLADAIRVFGAGGGTNCSLPMRELQARNIKRDAIVIYTDHQTWASYGLLYGTSRMSTGHPFEALKDYRRKVQENARLITVAMAANNSQIGEQDDPLFLELVGMDANTPRIISEFVNGNV